MPHYCVECGAEHWLPSGDHLLDRRVRVELRRDGVETLLESQLNDLDARHRRLVGASGWRVEVGDHDVFVCVVDWSVGSPYLSSAFAAANHVLFVVANWGHYATRFGDGSNILGLHEMVAESGALRRALDEVTLQRLPLRLAAEPRPVYRLNRQVQPLVVHQRLGARELLVEARTVTLDGVEVLGSRAEGLIPVLRYLVERWREDLSDGKAPEDHCCFSVAEIRDGIPHRPSEATLRRQIGRLRQAISSNYERRTGQVLDQEEVVEHVAGLGYRLASRRLVARSAC